MMRKTVEDLCNDLNNSFDKMTKPRKIVPLFSKSCCKCGSEVKWEAMWEITVPLIGTISDMYAYKYGCKQCFPEAKLFYNQLKEDGHINKSSWVFREKPANVNLRKWAVMSGYYDAEEVKKIKDVDLVREWANI